MNYARFLHLDPEHALRETSNEFLRRFNYIEERLQEEQKDIYAATLAEMDTLWNEAKEKM